MILFSLKKMQKFGLNPENIWRFFLKIGRIMAIEVLKNHLILALKIFNIAFWLSLIQPFFLLSICRQKNILKMKCCKMNCFRRFSKVGI
jgi:hypothetical protein